MTHITQITARALRANMAHRTHITNRKYRTIRANRAHRI